MGQSFTAFFSGLFGVFTGVALTILAGAARHDDTVRAQRFELLGPDGHIAGTWDVFDGLPIFEMHTDDQSSTMAVSVGASGAVLELGTDHQRVRLGDGGLGAALTFDRVIRHPRTADNPEPDEHIREAAIEADDQGAHVSLYNAGGGIVNEWVFGQPQR